MTIDTLIAIGNILTGLLIMFIGGIKIVTLKKKSKDEIDTDATEALAKTKFGRFRSFGTKIIYIFGATFIVGGILRLIGVLEPFQNF